jgi:hypothetical protein
MEMTLYLFKLGVEIKDVPWEVYYEIDPSRVAFWQQQIERSIEIQQPAPVVWTGPASATSVDSKDVGFRQGVAHTPRNNWSKPLYTLKDYEEDRKKNARRKAEREGAIIDDVEKTLEEAALDAVMKKVNDEFKSPTPSMMAVTAYVSTEDARRVHAVCTYEVRRGITVEDFIEEQFPHLSRVMLQYGIDIKVNSAEKYTTYELQPLDFLSLKINDAHLFPIEISKTLLADEFED